jgi:bifunctional UDP-N-acetylglucosamine pyrophosphorylase/glucosamine-1-phosphate N-acetyltransferase
MHSDRRKVLHARGGRPLLSHVLGAARSLSPRRVCVVVGHGAGTVRSRIPDPDIGWVLQEPQLGTAHALMQALPSLEPAGIALLLYGDVPLIAPATLRALVEAAREGRVALLTQVVDQPRGYGRIVRDAHRRVARIVEEKDATGEERAIREVNTGIMALPVDRLPGWLSRVRNDNAQGEYYLTDVVALAAADGVPIEVRQPSAPYECLGVNSPGELAVLERRFQMNESAKLLESGVTLADPARIDVRGELRCGRDVSIDVNCIFEGSVVLGDGVRVGANCILRDVTIGAGTEVKPFSMLEEARSGPTPASALCAHPLRCVRHLILTTTHIGNSLEVKASSLGRGSKANHLAYLGDSTVGSDVNIGAGTITCNYDGANKHRTVIEDDVHIGSDVQLVAPVTVGKGATIGAGATITRDVPPGGLTLTEKKQVTRPEWRRPRKK